MSNERWEVRISEKIDEGSYFLKLRLEGDSKWRGYFEFARNFDIWTAADIVDFINEYFQNLSEDGDSMDWEISPYGKPKYKESFIFPSKKEAETFRDLIHKKEDKYDGKKRIRLAKIKQLPSLNPNWEGGDHKGIMESQMVDIDSNSLE